MTTVIFGNRWDDLRLALSSVQGSFRWLSLTTGEEAARIARALRTWEGCEEVGLTALIRQRRDDFRARYIEFMGSVNEANGSKFWWAMPFTTKNPPATPLCRDTFDFLLIADLVESDSRPLVVITDSADLVAQARAWAQAAGIGVRGRVWGARRWWRWLETAVVVVVAARMLSRWARARRYHLPRRLRPKAVLASIAHSHSFTDGHYRDVYFGPLLDHLAARGHSAVVVAILLERAGESLIAKFGGLRSAIPVVPVEACLELVDGVRCMLHGLWRAIRPFRLAGLAEMAGRDVRILLERSVRHACRDGTFLMSLRLYYAARRLGHRLDLDRCLYPFENRAFEKMFLTGLREVSPATRLVGYNHASITPSHTNFILGSHEAKVIPLPDIVLTVGPVVSDWLETEGRYPPGMFRPACALRQGERVASALRARRLPTRDILLVLATSLDEYVKALCFVEAACRESAQYRLRIRAHPEFRLVDALQVAAVGRPDFFEEDRQPLDRSLEQADVVLYASSTVGLEAVARGIPAIYLDLGNFLDTDPMFGWSELKWTAREPAALVPAVSQIDALPEEEFRRRQEKAQEYAARYLAPVTDATLELFLNA